MKPISKPLLMLLLCLTSAVSFSQVASTEAFSKFPETIDIAKSELGQAMTVAEGGTVTLNFSDLIITGKVVSNVQKYDNLQSILIKTEGFANAYFHLSKVINKDKTISYIGRLLSDEAIDGYDVKSDLTGNYQLKKVQRQNLLQLCTQQ